MTTRTRRSERQGLAVESPALALLEDINRDFASSLNLDETLQRTIDRVMQHLHVEAASIFLHDTGDGSLVCQRCTGPVDITGTRVAAGQGIVGLVVATGQAVMVEDARQHPGFAPHVDERSGFVTRSLLCVPLQTRGERLGALELINRGGEDGPFSAGDLDLASAVAAAAALAIQNVRMVRELLEQERMRKEIELARDIQLSLLPAQDPTLAVAGLNLPARRVSGDFYDFQRRADGMIHFCIADVAGKGMDAALLMTRTLSLLRCLSKTARDPASLLEQINTELYETESRGLFVTLVTGLLDPLTGDLVYANAGHHPPLLRLGRGHFECLPVQAPPLGVLPTLGVPNQRLSLTRGPCYLHTDGVTEARNPAGVALGQSGLLALLDEVDSRPLRERLPAIITALRGEQREFHDDLTLLALAPAIASQPLLSLEFPAEARRLKTVRRELSRVLLAQQLDPKDCEALVVAVNEACMNIMQHAYGEVRDGPISLDLRRVGDRLDVLLVDHAPPVDHQIIGPRDLSDLRPGGLGTHFIQSVVDEWQYGHLADGRGNTLRLCRKLCAGKPEEGADALQTDRQGRLLGGRTGR
ncbi:MAG: GAF domain-containing protein [Gammaproteobacteria bacterium]|nr:GAF domain-containing protein [Gammaproteobacteria bacterium]